MRKSTKLNKIIIDILECFTDENVLSGFREGSSLSGSEEHYDDITNDEIIARINKLIEKLNGNKANYP